MNKERFLTAGWNNLLSLLLGLPAAGFVIYAVDSGLWTELGGLAGMVVVGVFY